MAGQKLELKSIRVADWMTENVLAVETYDSIAIARQVMAKHRVNQLPVLDNDNLVGIVTDRDLRDAYPTSMMIDQTKAIDSFAEKVTVEEVMTHDILIVRPAGDGGGLVAETPHRFFASGAKQESCRHHHAQ